jgi:fermentation-respiration switch protein FrsA (DUF1100 family)
MKYFFLALSFSLQFFPLYAQQEQSFTEESVSLETADGTLYGTLTLPADKKQYKAVALIIAGSGPTDRNGNNPFMTNNSLQMLAHYLAEYQIASLRYDKRGIAESSDAATAEDSLRFDDYVDDAIAWTSYLNEQENLGKTVIIGHSEGSLIGMLAAQEAAVEKFISVAGPAQSGDQVLRQQLSDQPEAIREPSFAILDSLAEGKTVKNVPNLLYALFRPSVQPYLLSWFNYIPSEEIKDLAMPILIVQGTTDIQVSEAEAQMLAKAVPDARLVIVEGMNHIMKEASSLKMQNAATYNQPQLPLVDEATQAIVDFIRQK